MALFEDVRAEHVNAAIEEYDALGGDAFLRRYGFGRSQEYLLWQQGQTYDSKAILGVALGHAEGRPATSSEFNGGVTGAAQVLSDLGFTTDPLSELVERDRVQLGPDAQVAVAYPFSASPTTHRVLTEHGRAYWAMCAIDALGMPYLLHHAAEVRAQEPRSDRVTTIAIDPATETSLIAQADLAEPRSQVCDRRRIACGFHGAAQDMRAGAADSTDNHAPSTAITRNQASSAGAP